MPGNVPNTRYFSYNSYEPRHISGAPNSVDAACNKPADAVIAAEGKVGNLEAFVEAIDNRCFGIIVLIIGSKNFEEITKLIVMALSTMKVLNDFFVKFP